MQLPIRIGTRGSPLALAQSNQVRTGLMEAHELGEDDVEIHVIRTTGDKVLDRPLAEIGGKELFTKEIEEALLDERIDLAVHSAKDMPTQLPDGLTIAAFLTREDVRDAFISVKARSIAELAEGAVIGTASLRRAAQIRHLRPDLKVTTLRGNVETRLLRISEGKVDATFLALAGLKRLGLQDRATAIVETDVMLPAVAQGAICIEARSGDEGTASLLEPVHDAATAACVHTERAFLAALDGSCRTPIGGLARLEHGTISFRGEILTPDGGDRQSVTAAGPAHAAEALGADAGARLRSMLGSGYTV